LLNIQNVHKGFKIENLDTVQVFYFPSWIKNSIADKARKVCKSNNIWFIIWFMAIVDMQNSNMIKVCLLVQYLPNLIKYLLEFGLGIVIFLFGGNLQV
jgi:hypothetical protein